MEIKNREHCDLKSLVAYDEKVLFSSPLYFPDSIELPYGVHGILNGMRYATDEDGMERYAIVGRKKYSESMIASEFIKGNKREVPSELISQELKKAYFSGVEIYLDIHSHPSRYVPRIFGSLRPYLKRFTRDRTPMFSTGDLYCMVLKENFCSQSMLVDGQKNLLVTISKESVNTLISQNDISQFQFKESWHNHFGIGNDFMSILKHNRRRQRLEKNPLLLNFAIAEKHKLVIYQGDINEDLIRIYPPLLPQDERL